MNYKAHQIILLGSSKIIQ